MNSTFFPVFLWRYLFAFGLTFKRKRMKFIVIKSVAWFLAGLMVLSPGTVPWVLAQESDNTAPDEQTQVIRQLAEKGYLGDKKNLYLSAESLTDDGVTDALIRINDVLLTVNPKKLKPGDPVWRKDDLTALLKLVRDKADDIRERKVSAWKLEDKLKKMIAALTPSPGEADLPEVVPTPVVKAGMISTPAEKPKVEPTVALPPPAPTATPVPGPKLEDFNALKASVQELSKKTQESAESFDKRFDEIQKENKGLKSDNESTLEQLKLVKRLIDQVQGDLKKMDDRLEQVAEKASRKAITDTELQQELTIMHKDLRDNTEDVSILKAEVAKLDKAGHAVAQGPLDEALGSKWLAGGALLVGLAALIVTLTRK
jgi:hypothetical protein